MYVMPENEPRSTYQYNPQITTWSTLNVCARNDPIFLAASKGGAHFPVTNGNSTFVAGKWAPPLGTAKKSGQVFHTPVFFSLSLDLAITDNSDKWEINGPRKKV